MTKKSGWKVKFDEMMGNPMEQIDKLVEQAKVLSRLKEREK